MKKGICKLCGQNGDLLKQSHVYPAFIYKGVFDSTQRTILASLTGKENHRYYQTGFFDKYVLCQHCDNVTLGRLERYASSVMPSFAPSKQMVVAHEKENDQMTTMHISGIDYSNIKLFVLSLLWRAHLSNNKFFNRVSLPSHENVLKKMILENDPGPDDLYEMAIIRIEKPNGEIIAMIPTPEVYEDWKLDVAIIIISGLIFCVALSTDSNFKLFPEFSLKSSNQIRIPKLKGSAARSFMTALGIPEQYANYYSGTTTDAF